MELKYCLCGQPLTRRNARQQLVRTYASEASNAQRASWPRRFGAGLVNYGRNLKWVPIPLGVGFAYICYQQYGHIKKRERRKELQSEGPESRLASQWQVN